METKSEYYDYDDETHAFHSNLKTSFTINFLWLLMSFDINVFGRSGYIHHDFAGSSWTQNNISSLMYIIFTVHALTIYLYVMQKINFLLIGGICKSCMSGTILIYSETHTHYKHSLFLLLNQTS